MSNQTEKKVPVFDVDHFRAGDSMGEMAKDYGVDEKEIEEALRFEQRFAA